jgi:hypothetical protein
MVVPGVAHRIAPIPGRRRCTLAACATAKAENAAVVAALSIQGL